MPMSVSWEMLCMEMACCSFGKTRWKLLGRLSIPYSQMKPPCIHTNQARGDLLRRIAWLSTWAAGTIPKKTKSPQPMIRKPRKATDLIRRANNDDYDGLQTTMPTVSACSDNQPQISGCLGL